MNKREAKQIIYRRIFQMLQPTERADFEPSGLTEREQETFDTAAQEIMREMESRSNGRSHEKAGQ